MGAYQLEFLQSENEWLLHMPVALMSEKITLDASSCMQLQILAQHLDLPNAPQAISALPVNIFNQILNDSCLNSSY